MYCLADEIIDEDEFLLLYDASSWKISAIHTGITKILASNI